MSSQESGNRGPTGIFIPYEKLLENLDAKLDRILEKLDAKVDKSTFESFRAMYEERHRDLSIRQADTERSIADRPQLLAEFREAQVDIENLKADKAGRDAVKAQNRYYLAGGGLVGLLVLVNLALTLVRISTGHL